MASAVIATAPDDLDDEPDAPCDDRSVTDVASVMDSGYGRGKGGLEGLRAVYPKANWR